MKIIPVSEIKHRLPQTGRIRLGSQDGNRAKRSETFILSSQRRDVLEPLAGRYGGSIEPWENRKTDDKWRVFTESDRIEVALPREPLSAPGYVAYRGSRLTRRCDGTTCIGYPEDGPPVEVPCLCLQEDRESKRPCRPRTHLSVLLPESPIGQWRLVTGSAYAQQELYASAEAILLAAQIGLPRAWLTIETRTQPGKIFQVPVLTSMHSLQELERASQSAPDALPESSAANSAELARPTPMALPRGAEIVDAEIMEDLAEELGPEW